MAAGGFDIVIDTVGGAVLDGSRGLLREGGRLVTLGAPRTRSWRAGTRSTPCFSSSSRTPAS